MTVENAPGDWDETEETVFHWSNIKMRELVYSDLPESAVDAIRDFIMVDECKERQIERVERLDPQTLQIVWYDDEMDRPDDQEDPSRISHIYISRVREIIQNIFGEQWRVQRKRDERYWNNKNPQRVVVRRADHQRFKYTDESEGEYQMMLHGRPDGVPDGVERYRELDHIPEVPVDGKRDVFVYETGTGTKHLLPAFGEDLVVHEQSCECGLTVQPEEIIEDDSIQHYAEVMQEIVDRVVEDGIDSRSFDLDPNSVLKDDLCSSCWSSHAYTSRYGGHDPPNVDYSVMLYWDMGEYR